MCKTKTTKAFNQYWRELVIQEPNLKKDKIAKSEYWANYIHSMCESGEITLKQYETWLEV